MTLFIIVCVIFEVLSLLSAVFLYFFVDLDKITGKVRVYDEFEDDFILFLIAFFLGWCAFPIYLLLDVLAWQYLKTR